MYTVRQTAEVGSWGVPGELASQYQQTHCWETPGGDPPKGEVALVEVTTEKILMKCMLGIVSDRGIGRKVMFPPQFACSQKGRLWCQADPVFKSWLCRLLAG